MPKLTTEYDAHLSIRLPAEVRRDLDAVASAMGHSVSDVVRIVVDIMIEAFEEEMRRDQANPFIRQARAQAQANYTQT